MNIVKSLITVLVIFSVSTSALAAPRVVDPINWTDTEVSSNYNENTKSINMFVSLETNIEPSNKYLLELRVQGKRTEEKFEYNSLTDTFSASLDISEVDGIRDPQSYSLRIKDTRKNTYYIINQFIGNNSSTPVSTNGLTASARAEVSTLIDAIVKNIPTSADTLREQKAYLDEVVVKLIAYNRSNTENPETISEVIRQLQGVNTVITPVNNTVKNKSGSYTPKYKSQSEEPKKINGIGNNPNYSSWRVGN